MWIFTKRGFYSVSTSIRKGKLAVRARMKADLVAFKKHYCKDMGRIEETPQCDYPYRADITPGDMVEAMAKATMEVDYTKFKPEAALHSSGGHSRHTLYLEVWSAMYDAERKLANMERRGYDTDDADPMFPRRKPAAPVQEQP